MKKNSLLLNEKDRKNFAELMALREDKPTGWVNFVRNHKNDLVEWLLTKTPLLDSSYTLPTRLYWVKAGMIDFPKCRICGKPMKKNVDSFEKGYFRTCSRECGYADPERQKKIERTTEKNWGSKNFFSSDAGKEVKRKWCEEHGVDNPFQLEEVKQKSCESRKENFGYEYTMQSPEKRKLASDSYKDKTGYDHQFKNPATKAKTKKTIADRKARGDDVYALRRVRNRSDRYELLVGNSEVHPVFSKDEFMRLDKDTQYLVPLKWKCLKCGEEFESELDQNFSSRFHIPARCPRCHPLMQGTSEMEKELRMFVTGLCGESVQSTRKVIPPLELDIYSASKKIAVEFDGLFWHSENGGGKGKDYHVRKTNACEKAGVKLIHVFEDEWLEKRAIVESRLRNAFGVYDRTAYARKCEVKETSAQAATAFLDENHIQGACQSSVRLGLYDKGELVALMTFGRCRFSKKYEWELLRFCNKTGCHVPGGAGKLLKAFERNYGPKSLLSYADRRWSQGELYEALGFKLDHVSPPAYWYVKGERRYSRVMFQKHRLPGVLKDFDPGKTEIENMLANGYDRIFDCGNLVYVKEYLDMDNIEV